jgi:hypothetical protein
LFAQYAEKVFDRRFRDTEGFAQLGDFIAIATLSIDEGL